jgi:carboxyl-terminal processing protease
MKVDESIARADFEAPIATRKNGWSWWLVAGLVGLAAGFWLGQNFSVRPTTGQLDYAALDEIYSELQRSYDGEINQDDLLSGATRGVVEGLGDPYTQLFSGQEAQQFADDLEGEFEGIGIEILNKDGNLTIMDVLDQTPAETAQLTVGDLVVKVDDQNTLDWPAEDAVKIIRGPAGSVVKLTIARENELKEIEIKRAAINNPSVKYEIRDGIGWLQISRFGENDTARLARQAAQSFVEAGVQGVVLDVRGNGGGFVSAAVDVASLWLDKGQVVTAEKVGQTVSRQEVASGRNILKGYKTVVLIDGGSASASEILAGALQDYDLATVLGKKSFGKGSVQTLRSLSGNAQLKVTIAKWYTPDGRNIDKTGIEPNQEVDFDRERYQADGFDSQLEKALELIKQ